MNGLLALFAVGLPLVIFYNIFQSAPPSSEKNEGEIQTEIEKWLSQNPEGDYRLHSAQTARGAVRVNIVLVPAPADEEEVRLRTLNALYDIQAILGKDQTISVWASAPKDQDVLTLLGVAVFSSMTDRQSFQSSREITRD